MPTLNEGQRKAVESNHSQILCLAGAGTGKTYTLIARISRIAKDHDPASILALTFTNAAAFEMRERYKKLNPKSAIPEFRTFHSFCYSIVCKLHKVREKLGYKEIPIVPTDAQIKEIETKAKIQLNISISSAKLSGKAPIELKDEFEYNLYKKRVKQLMRQKNYITYDDLCYDVCQLFVENDPLVANIKASYKYILCDEFQDTDPRQWEFIKSFNHADKFIVGDALQAIYAFRGADSSIIKSIAEDESWEVIKLTENYRSGSAIVKYANKISMYAKDSYRIEMTETRKGGKVTLRDSTSCNYMEPIGSENIDVIQEFLISPERSGTTAILSRTNKEVELLVESLNRSGFNISTGKKNDEYIHVLKSIKDTEYEAEWLSTFLTADTYARYLRELAIDDSDPYLVLKANYINHNLKIRQRFDLINSIRSIFRSGKSKIHIAKAVLYKLAPAADVEIEIDENIDSDGLIQIIQEAIEAETKSEVYVGTIHSSKGLEYDNVFIVNVGDWTFKLDSEENKNLFYVGVTRARENLTVFRGVY